MELFEALGLNKRIKEIITGINLSYTSIKNIYLFTEMFLLYNKRCKKRKSKN